MTRSDPQPSKNRDKTHRTDGGTGLQKDDAAAAGKDDRGPGHNSSPQKQGHGVDERGRYGKTDSAS